MDMKFEKHCWAEIDLDALRHNFAYIRQAVGGPVCAVVKADAYGHGDVATAKTIQQAGVAGFAVSAWRGASSAPPWITIIHPDPGLGRPCPRCNAGGG